MTDTATPAKYRGRFAPSPTGPLHFGSLVAALGSFLQARAHGGEWWLRIEDIDPLGPMAASGGCASRTSIPSARRPGRGTAFPDNWKPTACTGTARCDTSPIGSNTTPQRWNGSSPTAVSMPASAVAGTLRPPPVIAAVPCTKPGPGRALRLDTRGLEIDFEDALQGRQTVRLETTGGDFVLRRSDGLFSYQLAVALDDAEQGMTEVVSTGGGPR